MPAVHCAFHGKSTSWEELVRSIRFFEEQTRLCDAGSLHAVGDKGVCWNCGKTGHYSWQHPHAPSGKGNGKPKGGKLSGGGGRGAPKGQPKGHEKGDKGKSKGKKGDKGKGGKPPKPKNKAKAKAKGRAWKKSRANR